MQSDGERGHLLYSLRLLHTTYSLAHILTYSHIHLLTHSLTSTLTLAPTATASESSVPGMGESSMLAVAAEAGAFMCTCKVSAYSHVR